MPEIVFPLSNGERKRLSPRLWGCVLKEKEERKPLVPGEKDCKFDKYRGVKSNSERPSKSSRFPSSSAEWCSLHNVYKLAGRWFQARVALIFFARHREWVIRSFKKLAACFSYTLVKIECTWPCRGCLNLPLLFENWTICKATMSRAELSRIFNIEEWLSSYLRAKLPSKVIKDTCSCVAMF